nr:hypothetical protein [Paenibacillus sophorae]
MGQVVQQHFEHFSNTVQLPRLRAAKQKRLQPAPVGHGLDKAFFRIKTVKLPFGQTHAFGYQIKLAHGYFTGGLSVDDGAQGAPIDTGLLRKALHRKSLLPNISFHFTSDRSTADQ